LTSPSSARGNLRFEKDSNLMKVEETNLDRRKYSRNRTYKEGAQI
jgi:hypothetical protein